MNQISCDTKFSNNTKETEANQFDQNFATGEVFCHYSKLVRLYEMGETLSFDWHEWFSFKGGELKIFCCGLTL